MVFGFGRIAAVIATADVSREQVIARINEKLAALKAEASAEQLAELTTFARGFLGNYQQKNPEWHKDAEITQLAAAVAGADCANNHLLLGNFYYLQAIKAERENKVKVKEISVEEKELMAQGVLPPIASKFQNEVFEILDSGAANSYEKLRELAVSTGNSSRFKCVYNVPVSGDKRYVWVDDSKLAPASGIVALNVKDGKVRTYVCNTADFFLIVKNANGFEIMAESEGQFVTQNGLTQEQAEVLIEPVILNFEEASAMLIPPTKNLAHAAAKGVCPSCTALSGCAGGREAA